MAQFSIERGTEVANIVPWRILALETLGDFYLSKGQKIKAKDIYNQAIKIKDIPEIFKKDLEKKIKELK